MVFLKVLFVTMALTSIALAENGSRSQVQLLPTTFIKPKLENAFTSTDPYFKITGGSLPPDDGISNWGDYVQTNNNVDAKQLYAEVVILANLLGEEQDLYWTVDLVKGVKQVTEVRVLNLGRQRGYCYTISSNPRQVDMTIRMPPFTEPRILVEVYGV